MLDSGGDGVDGIGGVERNFQKRDSGGIKCVSNSGSFSSGKTAQDSDGGALLHKFFKLCFHRWTLPEAEPFIKVSTSLKDE
jgi:hypothetical protein